MTHQALEDFLLSMPQARLDFPFDENTAVYKAPNNKMFALVTQASDPIRLSLKGDPQLNELLRDKYETVLPGWHLNKKHWNTIILTGQLDDNEIKDLIRHSYQLVIS